MARLVSICLLAAVPAGLAAAPSQASFPGRSGRIAYTSAPESGPARAAIYTMAASGEERRRLTPRDGSRNPMWSADGKRIVFDRASALYVMNGDGTQRHRVRTGGVRAFNPAWSPSGRRLVFEGCRGSGDCDNDRAIFVARARGRGVKRIAAEGADPVWSPTGKWIAYRGMLSKSDACPTLLRMGPGGGRRSAILPRHRDEHGTCSWGGSGADFSPDGRRLVYLGLHATRSETFPNPIGGTFKVWHYDPAMYTVGVDGKNRTLVATRSLDRTEWFLTPFAWSPDGDRLLWRDDRGTQVARTSGQDRRQIAADGGDLAWQPISRR